VLSYREYVAFRNLSRLKLEVVLKVAGVPRGLEGIGRQVSFVYE
jgi:hypothetical protein